VSPEAQKSQLVRLVDVLLLGPLLIAWALRGRMTRGERALLAGIGALTIVYNGANYLANAQAATRPTSRIA
jgi:uncharacterized membrane protein